MSIGFLMYLHCRWGTDRIYWTRRIPDPVIVWLGYPVWGPEGVGQGRAGSAVALYPTV